MITKRGRMKYKNLREEELKSRVAQDFFSAFDCCSKLKNIDFAVRKRPNPAFSKSNKNNKTTPSTMCPPLQNWMGILTTLSAKLQCLHIRVDSFRIKKIDNIKSF
jgi:hypothetical protein